MICFESVMQRMKKILAQKFPDKVRDKDLALALNLAPAYYAVIKKRKKIPFASISQFCAEKNISMNWVLLDQKPVYLKEV